MSKSMFERIGDAAMKNMDRNNGGGLRGDFASAQGVDASQRTFGQKMDFELGRFSFPQDEEKEKKGWPW